MTKILDFLEKVIYDFGGDKMKRSNEANGSISENLKKGITEMLILSFLDKRDMHIYAITSQLDELSNSVCKISYPYAAIYRLVNSGYIAEAGKKVDDNRLRQFYSITPGGREYLSAMRKEYELFISGVNLIYKNLEGGEFDA
ncbi:MAG: PadR family transcriptional regulator [Clostridia bacterium]|nr:PadR family transcriptional regulator [Clostridia bacterium]